MLNEYKEYYDYTRDLALKKLPASKFNQTSNIYGRLQHSSIIKRFGIKRAMTIIARRVLFHDTDDINKIIDHQNDIPIAIINNAIKAVQDWCSYSEVKNPIFPELIGKKKKGAYYEYSLSAVNYHKKVVRRDDISDIKRPEYQKKLDDLKKQTKYWKDKYVDKQLFPEFYSISSKVKYKYNNKTYTIDSIVADAIYEGPLKDIKVSLEPGIVDYLKDKLDIKWNPMIPDIILIATIYKLRCSTNSNIYQILNTYELSNWIGKSLIKDDLKNNFDILSHQELYGEDIISKATKKVYFSKSLTHFIEINVDSSDIANEMQIVLDESELGMFRKEIKSQYLK